MTSPQTEPAPLSEDELDKVRYRLCVDGTFGPTSINHDVQRLFATIRHLTTENAELKARLKTASTDLAILEGQKEFWEYERDKHRERAEAAEARIKEMEAQLERRKDVGVFAGVFVEIVGNPETGYTHIPDRRRS